MQLYNSHTYTQAHTLTHTRKYTQVHANTQYPKLTHNAPYRHTPKNLCMFKILRRWLCGSEWVWMFFCFIYIVVFDVVLFVMSVCVLRVNRSVVRFILVRVCVTVFVCVSAFLFVTVTLYVSLCLYHYAFNYAHHCACVFLCYCLYVSLYVSLSVCTCVYVSHLGQCWLN